MEGWTAPAVAIVLLGQAAAAVWWASGTDTEVDKNTTAIEQVVENEKQIAVVQVQQGMILKQIDEIKLDNKELKEMTQEILNKLDN